MDPLTFAIGFACLVLGMWVGLNAPRVLRNWYWRLSRPATKADIKRFGDDVEG